MRRIESAYQDESIGVPGFEPGTSATQRRRATRLRHTPRRPVYGGTR